ncbi:MAG: hypothetical protein DWQ36_04815 [Acidobacteria bacterium]|nr:MAG: hypothetical protein DWQ30_20675 [Acidobacteriota bacterium]REK10117.1 MAG: hypothetical protein DWQ36_04815 [Acidobacteriota bacterium]
MTEFSISGGSRSRLNPRVPALSVRGTASSASSTSTTSERGSRLSRERATPALGNRSRSSRVSQ